MTRYFFAYIFFLWSFISANAQSQKDRWVDSVFNQLDVSAKVAQLFMVPVSPDVEGNKQNELENRIKNSSSIGGLLFTAGHPIKQVSLINNMQSLARVPLLIGQDVSCGALHNNMPRFPVPLAQGAIESDSLIFALGREIGQELKLMGVHMNMGLHANLAGKTELVPQSHFFGDDQYLVARKSLSFFKGMQSEGILSCAKYFSVSGITVTDIVKGLPVLNASADTVQTYPFQVLFKNGLHAVMPASTDLPLFYEKEKSRRKNKFSSEELS